MQFTAKDCRNENVENTVFYNKVKASVDFTKILKTITSMYLDWGVIMSVDALQNKINLNRKKLINFI